MRHRVLFYANEDGSVKCVSLDWLEGELLLGCAHVQIKPVKLKRKWDDKRTDTRSKRLQKEKAPNGGNEQ